MEKDKTYNIDDRKYKRKRNQEEIDKVIERKYGTPKWVKRMVAAGIAVATFVSGYGIGFKQGEESAREEQIEEKVNNNMPKNTFVPLVTITPAPTLEDNVKYEPWYTPVPTPSNNFFTNLKGASKQVNEAINSTANYYKGERKDVIEGCKEYEKLLNSTNKEDMQRLVEHGLGFSAQLASNVARAYIAQSEGLEYSSIRATYEKETNYNFHIRSSSGTLEKTALQLENGKIKTGILTMKKYPSEVYELLIYCGTMKGYVDETLTQVNIQKYAEERTSGDIKKAEAEILEVQKESYEKIKKFIKENCMDKEIEER